MSVILLPNRLRQQPQYAAPIDKGYWLAKDVTFAITGATPDFNAATGGSVSIFGGGSGFSRRATASGISLYTPDGGWADIACNQDWQGANTLILLCKINSIVDHYGGLFTKNASEGVTQFAIGRFSLEENFYATVDTTYVPKIQVPIISELTTFNTLVFTHSGEPYTPISFFLNGIYMGETGSTIPWNQPAGAGVLRLGGEPNSGASFDSDVDWLAFIRVNRVLSATEIAQQYQTFWSLWVAKPREVWVAPTTTSSFATHRMFSVF